MDIFTTKDGLVRGRRAAAWADFATTGDPGWPPIIGSQLILLTMSIVPLAEVKSHPSELVNRVATQHERVTATVHGRPSAVLLAVEDLEALEETIAVLADGELLKQLVDSDAELARGEGETESELAEVMKRRLASG